MSDINRITHDSLPEAVQHLLKDVEDIKNILLNQSAKTNPVPVVTETENDILSVEEVAKKLGYKEGTIYNYTHQRKIPHFKKGGRLFFDKHEINEWIRTDRRKTVQELQNEADQW